MKKKLLLFLSMFSVASIINDANAQTIPNNSFETWNTLPTFEHPVATPAPLFMSSNSEGFYEFGLLTVTKVPGVSGFGMHVETKLKPNGDTLAGIAAWGDVNNGNFNQGIPLPANQALTGATLDLKYNLTATTPGFIAFIPMNNGAPAGAGNGIFPGAYLYQLSGLQSSFTATTYTFSPALTINPDSCTVIIAAADMLNELGTPGDFIEVDNINWTGTTDVFPNGTFDVWQSIPAIDVPSPWRVDLKGNPGYTFAKSIDAFNGMYSLSLRTIGNSPNANIGQATLGYYNCPTNNGPCSQVPGMQLNSTPNSFGFYYKYTTPGVDTASAGVTLTKVGVGQVGGSWSYLLPTTNWTFRSMNLSAFQIPDSAFISFESGRWQTSVDGSELKIDDVKFHFCDETTPVVGPASVCVNSNGVQFSINQEFASNLAWSTSVGTINGSTTNPTVTIDNITGATTITVVKSYTDGCPDKTFNLNVTTTAAASSVAGSNQSVCSADSLVVLNGAVTGATGGVWSTNSTTGAFNDSNLLNATYIPSSADVTSGSVVLTLTPTGTGGCAVTTSNLTVTINQSPVVTLSLGTNDTVCDTDASFVLTGGLPAGGDYIGSNVNASDEFNPSTGVGTYAITYTYTAVNTCQASITTPIVVEACTPTSVGVVANIINSVYPNPSNGEFNFVLNNNNQLYLLEILDITGKVVYSENSNKNKLAINLNGISSGIYFARIISASFNANAKLIIK
jgi:hypothetical protein